MEKIMLNNPKAHIFKMSIKLEKFFRPIFEDRLTELGLDFDFVGERVREYDYRIITTGKKQELKVRAGTWSDILFEQYSNIRVNPPKNGWIYYCEADILAYYLCQETGFCREYWLDFPRVKKWVMENREKWRYSQPLAQNYDEEGRKRNLTLSFTVPIVQIKQNIGLLREESFITSDPDFLQEVKKVLSKSKNRKNGSMNGQKSLF